MGNYFSDISSVPIPDLTGKQISDLTRKQLLLIIEKICFNGDMDPTSFVDWNEMSLEQLRTVVTLLDNEMLDLLEAWKRRPADVPVEQMTPYAPCNLLERLYEWTRTSPNGREVYTQREITDNQRTQIAAAYLASLGPAERQRLEEEEQAQMREERNRRFAERNRRFAERNRRVEEITRPAIENFRRLGVNWPEVESNDLPGFEEYFIVTAAKWLIGGELAGMVQDERKYVLRKYLEHMYFCVQEWGDFEVWRHLRRREMLEDPMSVRVQIERILTGHAPVDSVREREMFDNWRPGNDQAMNKMWATFRLRYDRRRNQGRNEG